MRNTRRGYNKGRDSESISNIDANDKKFLDSTSKDIPPGSGNKTDRVPSTQDTGAKKLNLNAKSNLMGKISNQIVKEARAREIDQLDVELVSLLLKGYTNKEIADTTDNPLSTIQRRTRLIFERGLATSKIEPDYAKLGFRKGFLALRLTGGKVQSIAERLQKVEGIISVSANIGTFPIFCTIVYKDVTDLWTILSTIQEHENVKEVLWSEEVYNFSAFHNTPIEEKGHEVPFH
jgi:DNA-binding Lrp family transcriptional regulator